ncbi:MAG: EAL domain-containing protein [Oscillospiraceae bacterium]|nr:EAL domain-containing protein [Oscillospiraceae bacterium]
MDNKKEPELKMYYWPIMEPSFSKVIGYETCVKLVEKGLGSLPQNLFFPVAEKAGVGLSLGKWLFDEVCGCINKMEAKKIAFEYISMDLLAGQLRKKSIAADLLKIAEESQCAPGKICLEVHENFFGAKSDAIVERIYELKKAGFKIAIDNYSASLLPLSRLDTIPVDIIKLAKSLTERISADQKAAENVTSIIKQAKKQNIEIIAEDIEKEEQKELLMTLACEKMQGPIFGRLINSREMLSPRIVKTVQKS